jgi:hypothetical protein
VNRRPPLFNGFWFDTATGHATCRATREELAEAQRLWWKHRGIRQRINPDSGLITPDTDAHEPTRYARVVLIEEPDDTLADEWTQLGLDTLGGDAA